MKGNKKNDDSIARERWRIRFSTPEKYQEMVKGYYRLITGVDIVIGRIRETLEKQGLADNTVILLMGDNGFFLGEHGFAGKWYGYEESIRVPLILYDPRLPASKQGQIKQEMALNIDISLTILELAGLPIPQQVQGKSLVPIVQSKKVDWRDDFLYEHLFVASTRPNDPKSSQIPRCEGVVTARYKYLRYIDQEPVYEQLFDLKSDPYETKNLTKEPNSQAILERLRQRCDELCQKCE